MGRLNQLFTDLKDDNQRLASELRRLVEENEMFKEANQKLNLKVKEQQGVIYGLQSFMKQLQIQVPLGVQSPADS